MNNPTQAASVLASPYQPPDHSERAAWARQAAPAYAMSGKQIQQLFATLTEPLMHCVDAHQQVTQQGTKAQVLDEQGVRNEEIDQVLNDSARSLAQSARFARAGGEDPANLVREIQGKL